MELLFSGESQGWRGDVLHTAWTEGDCSAVKGRYVRISGTEDLWVAFAPPGATPNQGDTGGEVAPVHGVLAEAVSASNEGIHRFILAGKSTLYLRGATATSNITVMVASPPASL